mgnify:CR=1 FL=1
MILSVLSRRVVWVKHPIVYVHDLPVAHLSVLSRRVVWVKQSVTPLGVSHSHAFSSLKASRLGETLEAVDGDGSHVADFQFSQGESFG